MDVLKNTGILSDIGNKIQTPASYLFWLAMAAFAVYFAGSAIIQGAAFFKTSDERDKKECKGKIVNNVIGLIFTLIAGVLLNFLLKSIVGIDLSL